MIILERFPVPDTISSATKVLGSVPSAPARSDWRPVGERESDSWIEADAACADLEKHLDWNDLRIVKASSARS